MSIGLLVQDNMGILEQMFPYQASVSHSFHSLPCYFHSNMGVIFNTV